MWLYRYAASPAAHSQRSCAKPTQPGHQESLLNNIRRIFILLHVMVGTQAAQPTQPGQQLHPAPSCVSGTAARSCVYRAVTFTQLESIMSMQLGVSVSKIPSVYGGVCYFPSPHLSCHPEYFRGPHWKSMGLPEISKVTLTVLHQPFLHVGEWWFTDS